MGELTDSAGNHGIDIGCIQEPCIFHDDTEYHLKNKRVLLTSSA